MHGLECAHTGLPLKWEHLSCVACRSLGVLALASFSNNIVIGCRINCWAAAVNRPVSEGALQSECLLAVLSLFPVTLSQNHCWQLLSPENYHCKCEWEVIKWSALNVSLTQSLLQHTQLIATQNHRKPSLTKGVFIWHFRFPSFQEGFSVQAWSYLGR